MMMATNGHHADGRGSSSLSSNLSALAPPFSLDSSSFKPGVIRYPAGSSYSVNTSNPIPNPNPDPNPGPDHYPYFKRVDNPSLKPNAIRYPDSSYSVTTSNSNHDPNFFTSPTPYTYSSSIPFDVDPFSCAGADAIAYAHNPTTHIDTNPYYPSYVPCAIDDYGLPHQFGYDLLSTSQVTASSGSIADDYNQSLPALIDTSGWGCFCEGFPDWQQNEAVLTDANFYSVDNNGNPGFHSSMHIGTFEETRHGIDMAGSQKHIQSAIAQLDYDSILGDNVNIAPPSYPTFSTWESSAVVPEAYPRMTSTKTVNSRFHEILGSNSYEQYSASNTNSNESGLLMQSASAFVGTPPVQGIHPNIGTGSGQENKDIADNTPSTSKELHLSKSSKEKALDVINHQVLELEQIHPTLAEFSSKNGEEFTCNKNMSPVTLNHLFEEKPSSPPPHISLDSLNLAINSEVISSTKNSPESVDHYNPAVDSPCWKGSLPSSLSPFKGPEAQPLQIMRKVDAPKATIEKSSERKLDCDNQENYFIPSPERPSVADVLFKQVIENHTESGNHLPDFTNCHGVQSFGDLSGSRKECILPNKSMDSSDQQVLQTEVQDHEEGQHTLREKISPGSVLVDVGIKPNDDDVSSHTASNIAEDTMASSASAEDAPIRLIKSHVGESTSTLYVQNLVKTMHNLSDMLLFQCSRNALKLKPEDIRLLKDAVNNLDSCISKNGQRATTEQDTLINVRGLSQFDEKISKIQQGQFGYERVSEDENQVTPVKEDEDVQTVRVAGERVQEDNMTQAIKNILSENLPVEEEPQPQALLYRNLWLEAEASLCSLNFMARFNRMKVEMAKCSSQGTNDRTVMMSLLRSNATAGHCTGGTVAADAKGSPIPNNLFSNLSTLGANSHVDDVMARYQILKSRGVQSDSLNFASTGGFSSYEATADLSKAESSVQEVKTSEKPVIPIQESAMSGKSTLKDDDDAPVMARFHALRHRDDISGCINREEYQPGTIDSERTFLRRNSPASKGGLEGKKLGPNAKPVVQNLIAESSAEISTVREYHLFGNDDSVTQLNNRSEDQPLASWCDSSSSDWEHVVEEELGGR